MNIQQMAEYAAAEARRVRQENQALVGSIGEMRRQMTDLANALTRVQIDARAGDPNIQRVENIPGRRIPFTIVQDIPIRYNQTGVVEATWPIPSHGPFVAVRRGAAFLSDFQFRVLNADNTTADFYGRSNGRFRPIHSVWDLNDGQPVTQTFLSGSPGFPGTGLPHYISPSNESSFRTMQPDFRISFDSANTAIPRQSNGVPSSMYARGLSDPWELPCLDFFERNDVLRWRVVPLHPQNPSYGNVQNFATPGPFPFLTSQFDSKEGVVDNARLDGAGDPYQQDPVTRVGDGILVMMLEGYIIWQPPSNGGM